MQGTFGRRRPAAGTVLGALALVVAAAGGGYAVAQTGQPEVVVACQSNKMLFLADPTTGQCPPNQMRVELTTTAYTGFVRAGEIAELEQQVADLQTTVAAQDDEQDALEQRVTTSEGAVAALKTKLSKVRFSPDGLNGKPVLTIDGANLQIVSGSGWTNKIIEGVGNLFIGYNEHDASDVQTGSHNLIIGRNHTFTSYGGLLAGDTNRSTGRSTFVAGEGNSATGDFSSVSGGVSNSATGKASSVSGGANNIAGFLGLGRTSVSGGRNNKAYGEFSSILGGNSLTVSADDGTAP